MGRKKLVRKPEPRKLPPEKQDPLEQQPKSRWPRTKNQVVRATEVAVGPLITLIVMIMIWLLWREVIRVGDNSAYVLRGALTAVGILTLIGIGYRYEWTGFVTRDREESEDGEIEHGRTLWDWMRLLLVPLMLAGIAPWFTWWQNNSQQAQDERQIAQFEQEQARLAESQAQFSALQTYLGEMNHLMLEKHLLDSEEGDSVFALAQARTTTTITQLNGEHNQAVTRFLSDSGLLREPPLLAQADLPDAKLHKAVLQNANLAGTNLTGASLTGAALIEADFSAEKKVDGGTQLITADLTKADLSRAALQGADLSQCHLREATLTDATLQNADLSSADLQGADLSYAALQGANLSPATVPGFSDLTMPTNLTNANLRHAALQDANLSSADLSGADLTDADLTDARGWTKEQLTAARSLEGATMPNGQKYEDWLKDKKAQGKDEKNY